MKGRIAIAEPDLSGLEEEYALAAIRSRWISSQPWAPRSP